MSMESHKYIEELVSIKKAQVGLITTIAALFLVVAIVLLIIKEKKYSLITILIGFIFICFSYYVIVNPYVEDIKEENIVEYDGEFYVEKITYGKTHTYMVIKNINDLEDEKFIVWCDISTIKPGKAYRGIVVYSGNTRILFSIKNIQCME